MKDRVKSVLKLAVFLGLGVFLIWWVLKDLTPDQKNRIITSLKGAHYEWLALSLVLAVLSHVIRAARWKMLLAPLGYNPSLTNSFFATMVGYIANLAFPRLGEVSKCGVLQRYEKVPMQVSIGTIVVDRTIDVLSLGIVFVLAILSQFSRLDELRAKYEELKLKGEALNTDAAVEQTFMDVYGIYLLVGTVVFIALFLFLFREEIRSIDIVNKLKNIVSGFVDGLKSVKDVQNPLLFIVYSVSIWVLYFLMIYVSLFCLDETAHLGIAPALSLLAFGSLAMVATPGGIGAYPVAVMYIFSLYSISEEVGLASGWIIWSGQTLLVIGVGFISLVALPIMNKEQSAT